MLWPFRALFAKRLIILIVAPQGIKLEYRILVLFDKMLYFIIPKMHLQQQRPLNLNARRIPPLLLRMLFLLLCSAPSAHAASAAVQQQLMLPLAAPLQRRDECQRVWLLIVADDEDGRAAI